MNINIAKNIVNASILITTLALGACQTSVSTSSPQESSSGSSAPSSSSSSSSSRPSSNQSASGQTGSSTPPTITPPSPSGSLPSSQPSQSAPATGQMPSGRENGISVSGLPGLDPFPSDLPGTEGLEDIFGSGTQGAGTINGNTGGQGAGDAAMKGGSVGQGYEPFGDASSGGTIANGGPNGEGDDPFGDLTNGRNQPMTAADRQAVLNSRLDESIAVFDGMILTEREQAQGAANENDAGGIGGGNAGGAGRAGGVGSDGNGNNPIVIASTSESTSGNGKVPNMSINREGDFEEADQENSPAPADIPSGNDDDVVARQLREAAMNEVDPELRERLWNEYRSYTGLPIPQEKITEFNAI